MMERKCILTYFIFKNCLLIYVLLFSMIASSKPPIQIYIGSIFAKPTYNLFSIPNRSNYLYNNFSKSEVKVENKIMNAIGVKMYFDKKRKLIAGVDFDQISYRISGPDIVDPDFFNCALEIYRAAFHLNYAIIEGQRNSFFLGFNLNKNLFKEYSVRNARIEKYGNFTNTGVKLDVYRFSILPINPEVECLYRINIFPRKSKKSFIDIKTRIGLTAPLIISLGIPAAQNSLFMYTPFHKSIQFALVHQFGK